MNCYLSLGANLGDKQKNIRQAIELISQISGVSLIAVSHFYETEAWGVINQPNFINAAVRIKSTLQPLQLLDELQKIEYKLGRVRHGHWSARTIDIDILYIDDMKIDSDRLKIPHPFMIERDFVLVPLSEISGIKYNLHGDKVIKINGCLVDFNLKLIACVDKNFGLGYKGKLLFKIPEDMRRFRKLTLNNTVIMGRKTFESIGKPLDNRRNIILSKSVANIGGVEVVNNLEELYNILNYDWQIKNSTLIIGGGEIYRQLLPYVSEIYLTVVNEKKIADTFLTNFEEYGNFICDSIESHNNFEFRHYFLKTLTPDVSSIASPKEKNL